jgi:hypothetical protein
MEMKSTLSMQTNFIHRKLDVSMALKVEQVSKLNLVKISDAFNNAPVNFTNHLSSKFKTDPDLIFEEHQS